MRKENKILQSSKKLILASLFIASSLMADKIYATFDVEAKQSANLAFSTSGIIKQIKVDVGDKVSKNKVLARLHNEDLKASLNIVQTNLKFAKKDLSRQEKVKSIIDEAKYDSYQQKFQSANAQVIYQQAILDKTDLKAPFDGTIISKEIEIGDVVSGQAIRTAFTIQSNSKRVIKLQFDQKYYGVIKVGDIFVYKLDGSIESKKGIITKIYPFANSKTRKIMAEVEAKNILVGLFGDGYVEVE